MDDRIAAVRRHKEIAHIKHLDKYVANMNTAYEELCQYIITNFPVQFTIPSDSGMRTAYVTMKRTTGNIQGHGNEIVWLNITRNITKFEKWDGLSIKMEMWIKGSLPRSYFPPFDYYQTWDVRPHHNCYKIGGVEYPYLNFFAKNDSLDKFMKQTVFRDTLHDSFAVYQKQWSDSTANGQKVKDVVD